MLIVDGVARLEVRSKLIVGVIIEVRSIEFPDAWMGLRNVVDKIFEMHLQTVDALEHELRAWLMCSICEVLLG